MQGFKIRALKPSDSDQLGALLATRDNIDPENAKIRTGLQEWIAFSNPFTENGEITYYVAEADGEIVAFHGKMPVDFLINGQRERGYYVHDLYVHPTNRKKGQGFWLTMSLAKAIEEDTPNLFCLLGMTALNLQMQRRRGYYETEVDGYFKILNPLKQVKKVVKNKTLARFIAPIPKLAIAIADYVMLTLKQSNRTIEWVDHFDERFDKLFSQVQAKTGVSICRDSGYLNWKYVERPHRRESIITCKNGDTLTGFMVVSPSPYPEIYSRGMIIDLLSDPDDLETLRALCSAAIKYFRKQKMHSINCLLSDQKYIRVFKEFLFIKKVGKKVMLGNVDGHPHEEVLKDIRNWHMTLAESDAFMLST